MDAGKADGAFFETAAVEECIKRSFKAEKMENLLVLVSGAAAAATAVEEEF